MWLGSSWPRLTPTLSSRPSSSSNRCSPASIFRSKLSSRPRSCYSRDKGSVHWKPQRYCFQYIFLPDVLTKGVSRPFQTVALSRPATETPQPVQRIASNSLPMSSISPALSTTNSVASTHTTSPLRPQAPTVSPGTQSKLAGTNGTSTVKLGGFSQSPAMRSLQEGSQDKQVEQAKLVCVCDGC